MCWHWTSYFYPRPPRGGRPGRRGSGTATNYFYPRPPRGGRHHIQDAPAVSQQISIHALREEGDNFLLRTWHKADDFYPRPPRGGRPSTASTFTLTAYFYPRPPRGGRQLPQWVTTMIMNFYPRPPRGGRPRLRVLDPFVLEISIHALREEGDAGREGRRGRPGNFYPRPPRGGRL